MFGAAELGRKMEGAGAAAYGSEYVGVWNAGDGFGGA